MYLYFNIIFSSYYNFSLPSPPDSWLFQWIMFSLIYLLPPSTFLGAIYSISIIVLPKVSNLRTSFFSQEISPELQVCSRMCVRETYTFLLLLKNILLHKMINMSIKHYYALVIKQLSKRLLFENNYELTYVWEIIITDFLKK